MRCSEPGVGVVVAIVTSRAPGRGAWVVRPMKIYFETSAVIDYILATGREDTENEKQPLNPDSPCVPPGPLNYLKESLREDKRYRLATEVRRAIDSPKLDCQCVISPIVRYECYEWLAEERFR